MKQINGETVLFERWAKIDLDMVERRQRKNPPEQPPPTIPKGAKVFVVALFSEEGVGLFNFYYKGKIYHGPQALFSDVPLDAPPSTSLNVKTAERR
jgi:hypothetical protein